MDIIINEFVENVTTTTIAPDVEKYATWLGYIAVLISIVFFGSNFVPAAKYPIGDGLALQFFICCEIWTTGVIISLTQGSPISFPLVTVAGFLCRTGNCLSVFVIPIDGLGLSMLSWETKQSFR